jgi:hypothetical protein
MTVRKCSTCGEQKPISEFLPRKESRDGLGYSCRTCRWKIVKRSRDKHPGPHKCSMKKWYEANREKTIASVKRWQNENPEKRKEYARRTDKKIRSTPKGKLNSNISNRIWHALHGRKGKRHWEDLVGYTIDQLKRHLEKRFKPGMTWDNYGTFWEIDHKIPVSVFNYERPEDIDFRLCWSLKNLQPLEAVENNKKKAKLNKPFQPSLALSVNKI